MMRRPERSPRDQRLSQRQRACHRMDLGRLERLVETHFGENGGQPAGEHRLPRTRWADHQDVVTARRGDLEGALRVRLPLHFGEVDVVPGALGKQPGHIDRRARQLGPAIEKVRDLGQAARTQNPQAVDDSRF